jgi:cell division protein FtsA
MNSVQNNSNSAYKIELKKEVVVDAPKQVVFEPVIEDKVEETPREHREEEIPVTTMATETTEGKIRRSFFDRYVDKIKDFLDNAE